VAAGHRRRAGRRRPGRRRPPSDRLGRDQSAAPRPGDVRVQAPDRARHEPLAEILSSEHGKVIADSKGDIQRGLEVIEFACGIPHILKGEYTEGAGPGIDVYSMRQPLGVCAGITPFNFPAMIPMWMFGISIAVGNTFILKPSEKRSDRAGASLAELMMEAGAPAGVLNVSTATRAPSTPS
jgi:acyl-CoA reductase-like NAD-dependent aldehyde dehydrogenase